jgi:hypothetical protein
MGLDAVVYRNKKHLNLGPDEETARVIPDTGEVYFEKAELSKKYLTRHHAADHRLGNVSEIAELRDEVTRLAAPESPLIKKVLYSGTHSGDVIALGGLHELSAELDLIRKTGRESPQLQRLMGALEELIQAAKYEGNPIVFV